MYPVFRCYEFNECDLGDDEDPLRKKFNEIIKDLEENKYTSLGDVKLITGDGGIKYFRAKLSDSDRLLFTSIRHNDKDVFVILEVILNHDYHKSKFLTNKEKIKNIKITDQSSKEVSDNPEIKDTPQARWLDKFIILSTTQEDIVENKDLPLVVSGSAGSGKTSVALEKLRKIEEKFQEGKILYITQSESLIKKSKELYAYEYYDQAEDKLKIGVPEQIEFLSVHTFLEKITKCVEGKKPINRSVFFSWFEDICKKKNFCDHKKDGDKILEEFVAVIAGRSLTKEKYKELGNRQAVFPQGGERGKIYALFEEYRKFIKENSEYYDTSIITHQIQANKVYDADVVDEVQDLTESTLKLIVESVKDENFLLCGDVNQVIHPSFFSISRLESFLRTGKVCVLEKNYRNSKEVIELANRILHLKNYCFAPEDKMKEEEKRLFFMEGDTEDKGNISFIAQDKKQKMAKEMPKSINWAVLVLDDEKKEEACKLFDTPLVFSVHEAKGLEFENVILYKFMSCRAYDEIYDIVCTDKKNQKSIEGDIAKVHHSYDQKDLNSSRAKDKQDKSFVKYKFYMNALYVAATRANKNVYIIDSRKQRNLWEEVTPKVNAVDIKKEESTPEEWKTRALELIDRGNVEQARKIAEKLRLEEKTEYAQAIMNALEPKQAISELKTEPQKSSTMVSNEKREQNPNKKKKLTKKKLEENTNRLFLALQNGKLQEAEKLIEQGINVNATTKEEGDTPLHVAAYNGHERVVQLLLEHGADVNATSKDGDTPLHLAAEKGYKGAVQLLLEKKADINAIDKDRSTPLLIAAGNGYEGVVQLLLENKAKIDDSNNNGYTPLHIAAQKRLDNIVQLLLKHGANVDATTKEGYTPLHVAAQKAHNKRVVQLLLDSGAGVNVKDNKDYTPLHDAAQSGSKDVAQLLLNHGADINAQDENYVTPLLSALEYSYAEVFDLLIADPNINVGGAEYMPPNRKSKRDYEKYDIKYKQDDNLFKKVKEAANEKDTSKQDKLLKEIEKLLKPENKYGFKPSLNYSPNVSGKGAAVEVAIKAGGKVLQLLYDYAEKNIGTDTEIFKQLKQAKEHEKTQPKSDVSNVSVSGNLAQAQGFKLGGA